MTELTPQQIQKEIELNESELSKTIQQIDTLRWQTGTLLQNIEQASNITYRLDVLRKKLSQTKTEEQRQNSIGVGYFMMSVGLVFFGIFIVAVVGSNSIGDRGALSLLSIVPFVFFVTGLCLVVYGHGSKPK